MPLIRMRGLTARVSFPGAEIQETSWHQHLRQELRQIRTAPPLLRSLWP